MHMKRLAEKHSIKLQVRETTNKKGETTFFLTSDFYSLANNHTPVSAITKVLDFFEDYLEADIDVVLRRVLMIIDQYVDAKELRAAKKKKTAKEILSSILATMDEKTSEEIFSVLEKEGITLDAALSATVEERKKS